MPRQWRPSKKLASLRRKKRAVSPTTKRVSGSKQCVAGKQPRSSFVNGSRLKRLEQKLRKRANCSRPGACARRLQSNIRLSWNDCDVKKKLCGPHSKKSRTAVPKLRRLVPKLKKKPSCWSKRAHACAQQKKLAIKPRRNACNWSLRLMNGWQPSAGNWKKIAGAAAKNKSA